MMIQRHRAKNAAAIAITPEQEELPKETYQWLRVAHTIRRRWHLRYPLLLLSILVVVLIFGAVYSEVTTRDPCHVLEEMRQLKNGSDSGSTNFPRLFHYQSKTNEITEETITWRAVLDVEADSQEYPHIISKADDPTNNNNNEWVTVYWSDASCLKLVEEHYPNFLRTYQSFPHTIQRVDSCRYLILSKYGGVYADTDISLHAKDAKELESLIPDGVGLVESPFRYNEIWQNSLMTATVPNHPFWDTVVDIITERGGSNKVLSTTGPKMIGDAVERYRSNNTNRQDGGRGEVHTLPCELFQRLPSGQWDTSLLNILGRDVLARAVPMRGCGRYGDGRCEITRHAGKASWTKESLV